MHYKNRFHRACANVEGYLNYTKLKYFLLHQVEDKPSRKSAKTGL